MKKSVEEYLLGLVQDWRWRAEEDEIDLPKLSSIAIRDCADDLEEFVHCNPELKDLML